MVVDWSPAGASDGVSTDSEIDLTFSGYPDPDTVDGSSLLLSSGIFTRFGLYAVDLVSRAVRFRPINPLTPDVTFQVTVLSNLLSLQGCPARQETRTFRTADGPATVPPAPPPPTLADLLPIFAASCAGSGCHRDSASSASASSGGGCLAVPAKGLSLCDADARQALVNVDAAEVTAMKRVAPGDPARSYLLRKVIAPGAGEPPVVPGTLGERMPPGPAPLDDAQVRMISDWIAAGAP